MKSISRINRFYSIFFVVILLLITSCEEKEAIKVALSKGKGSEHYDAYAKWLSKVYPEIEYIDLYYKSIDSALMILNKCSGLVLTGGPDVHPKRYGQGFDSSRCEIDLKRDTLEFEIIRRALDMQLPLLAICRGEQILNVAMGGTLIVDIPMDFDTLVDHRCSNPSDCYHDVMIVDNSLLSKLSGTEIKKVNSNHHQAVDKLAEVFVPSAYSRDGLIEAYEWKDKSKHFLVAVQWHPERLDSMNKLSLPLARSFLQEVEMYYNKKYNTKEE
jgi:putative glutamine amidotransferase